MSDPYRAFLIGSGFILCGLAAFVLVEYAGHLKRGHRGALNWHVVMISASYLLWVLVAILIFYERAGTGFNIRLILSPIAAILGTAALILLLRDLRQRR